MSHSTRNASHINNKAVLKTLILLYFGNKNAYGSLRFPSFCLRHDFVVVPAYASLLQLLQLQGQTTPTKTTAYDAYGNNSATELLTTPDETQRFAYAKPCF